MRHAAWAAALVGTFALPGCGGSSPGNVSELLDGQGSVKSASISISISEAAASPQSATGVYDFRSATGRFTVEGPDHGADTMYVQGRTVYLQAAEVDQVMRSRDDNAPVPHKPWVAREVDQANPIGDVLFGLPVLPAPVALAQALDQRTVSMTSLGARRADGERTHEYRLVLDAAGAARTTLPFVPLGTRYPVLVWVDRDSRLVQLAASVPVKGAPAEHITLTYSQLNEPVTVEPPPASSVETWAQFWDGVFMAGYCSVTRPCSSAAPGQATTTSGSY
jgi:hypothetical protein